jgi:fatty-acyl-CoA synthase
VVRVWLLQSPDIAGERVQMAESLTDFIDALPQQRTAIDYGAARMAVGEIAAASRRLATGLRRLGVKPGDRVAVWLPNMPAWLACFFACARLGAIAVSVNTRFRSHEVQDILGRAACSVLVLWPGFKAIDFRGILAAVDPSALTALAHVVVYTEQGDEPAFTFPGKTITPYEELLAEREDDAAAAPATSRCVIFTTSGTTKAPKFVCHAQAGVVQHARDVARGFELEVPGARVLQALPLCGVFGFTQALAALAAGAPMRMLPLFDATEAARVMREEAITHANGGDDMLDRLLDACDEPRPFPHLRFFGYAKFNPALDDLVTRAESRGVIACGLYGMSEVHALYALQPRKLPTTERAKGGGELVSPAAAVRICDPDTGCELPPGEHGEIELKGPSLLLEYYGNPEATRGAFREGGWFRTGDLGYLDGPRRFCYVTRMGDVLRLGGFLTSPQEIEAVLEEHPAVQGAQVVGATLAREPVAVAFVVPVAGQALDEAALSAWCKARLAGYKIPRRFVDVAEFPTTPSANGTKIQRAKLREMAAALVATN